MNKLQKSVASFIKRNAALTKKASDEILGAVSFDTSPAEAQKIIDKVYKKYGIIAKRKELLMDSITDTASIAIGKSITGEKAISFQRWYMDKAYKFEGETFSQRAKSLGRLPELKKDIVTALKQGKSWRETAQSISDKKLTFTDVAKDVSRIADEARAMYGLSENAEGYADYLKSVKKVQARINRLTDQDTSKLKRAYQDILDITNKSSIAEIDNAVKYASYYKERYNAERIARTEMAKAYGDSTITEAVADEDVIGIKFVLSSGHPEVDICFVAGTMVKTPQGEMPIEELTIGNEVYDSNYFLRPVTNIFCSEKQTAIVFSRDFHRQVICSHNHPFLSDVGWIRADQIGMARIQILFSSMLSAIKHLLFCGGTYRDKRGLN